MNASVTVRQGSFLRLAPAVCSAAAAAIAGFIRLAIGDEKLNWVPPSDQASPIPPISERLIEHYAFHGAKDKDIADRFLIEVVELRRDYANVLRVARAMYNITIAKSQFDLARKPHGGLLTWLGKHALGQGAGGGDEGYPIPSYEEKEI